MFKHSIYSPEILLKVCLACCLSDSHHKLALKIAYILAKIAQNESKEARLLQSADIILALIYL